MAKTTPVEHDRRDLVLVVEGMTTQEAEDLIRELTRKGLGVRAPHFPAPPGR